MCAAMTKKAAAGPELELEASPKLSTEQLEAMLRAKYPRDRYALFFDVPDAVSLDARRRIDAVAVGIWKSVGREIEAFELKVSRSDWLREVKQVNKADPFVALCDRFWLVTGDPSVAKPDEVPACWGWMTGTKHGLRVQRPAQKLPRDRENLPWGFTLGLLRKLQDDLVSSPDVRTMLEESHRDLREKHQRELERAADRASNELKTMRETVARFEESSGIKLSDWRFGRAGEVVRSLVDLGYSGDGMMYIPKTLREQATRMRKVLEEVEAAAAEIESGQTKPPAESTA
jgi:hypothetical protein